MASVINSGFIVGTIGNVYELRRVGSKNKAVVDFSVAVTPRYLDGDNWKDGETLWTNCTAWDRLAENIAESFNKGDRVILSGRYTVKPGYTKENGEEVAARPHFTADYAGLEVTYAPAHSDRVRESSDAVKASSSGTRKPRAAAKPARKTAAKKAPAQEEFDFDDDDDDDDFGDEDMPF